MELNELKLLIESSSKRFDAFERLISSHAKADQAINEKINQNLEDLNVQNENHIKFHNLWLNIFLGVSIFLVSSIFFATYMVILKLK